MKFNSIVLAAILGLTVTGVAYSDEGSHQGRTMDSMVMEEQMAAQPASSVEVGNKICPVSGDKIAEGKEVKIEYKSKVYNLCCPMCKKDFLKSPEEYIKKLEAT